MRRPAPRVLALVLVVLVIDVTHDHLDDILMADETVGAAIFIDHQRKLGSLGLHRLQKVGGQHGGRCEKNFAHQPGSGDRLFQIDTCQVEIRPR